MPLVFLDSFGAQGPQRFSALDVVKRAGLGKRTAHRIIGGGLS